MKVKLLCILGLLFIVPIRLSSQTKISGIVTDGTEPLPGVNVVVLKSDTTLTAAVTDSIGHYIIENIAPNNYQLLFSIIGFDNKSIEINLSENVLQELNVVMKTQALQMDGVTVKARNPAFKYESGKTTVDLSAVSLGSDGSVLNILKKIPGIIILNDGTILLNGQTGASIMIDGKQTYLNSENLINLLRSMPADAVDKIEMVSQPSAKYDANGSGGFINIKRKKKTDSGLNIYASSNVEAGKLIRDSQNISLNLQKKNYTFYTDYSFYNGEDFMLIQSSRKYFNNDEPIGLRLDMQADRKFSSHSHYFKTGMEYVLSEKITTGAYIYGNWFKRKKDETALSDFFRNQLEDNSSLNTVNEQRTYNRNITGGANLDYKFSSKLKLENLFTILSFDQQEKMGQKSNIIQTNEIPSNSALLGNMDGNIQISSLQSGLVYEKSDTFSLQPGIKSSFISINNNALYNSLQSGEWMQDKKLSSGFRYKERVTAGWIQTKQKWSKHFSTEAGLRFEHTVAESYFLTDRRDSTFTRTYSQLFPSVSGNWKLSQKHTLTLQYNQRIVRPNYRDLNPFTEVNDPYLQERGNTKLRPELLNNIETSWIIKSRYIVSMFYTLRKNPITKSYLTESESEATIVMPLNLKQSSFFGLRAGLNSLKPAEWWTTHFNTSFTYKEFNWQEADKLYNNKMFTPAIQTSNQFSFPNQWAVEAVGFFNGSMAEGQARLASFGSLSIGARKSFFENKLNLYVYINDIFLTNKQNINLRNSIISGEYTERRDTRMAGMTLTWNFNSGNMSKTIRKAENTEENKRIN